MDTDLVVEQQQALDSMINNADEVTNGLFYPTNMKTLPIHLLYECGGSQLYEEIEQHPDYYPYSTELKLLKDQAVDLVDKIHPQSVVIELGCGDCTKTNILLKELARRDGRPVDFVGIDSSIEALEGTRLAVQDDSEINFSSVHGTFFDGLSKAIQQVANSGRSVCILLLGSTIGNMPFNDSKLFLENIVEMTSPMQAGTTVQLVVGFDMWKDKEVLKRAYDNEITRIFELGGLRNALNLLDSTYEFIEKDWRYHVDVSDENHQIEMKAVSLKEQTIGRVSFEENESILLEISHKFTPEELKVLTSGLGFVSVFGDESYKVLLMSCMAHMSVGAQDGKTWEGNDQLWWDWYVGKSSTRVDFAKSNITVLSREHTQQKYNSGANSILESRQMSVSAESRTAYQANGLTIMLGLSASATEEARKLAAEVNHTAKGHERSMLLQALSLQKYTDTPLRMLALLFGRAAAELLGVSRVRLYHDDLLQKQGGSKKNTRVPWHVDHGSVYGHFPFDDAAKVVSAWMSLEAASVDHTRGGLVFCTNEVTHDGVVADIGDRATDEDIHEYFETNEASLIAPIYHPGDITFHSSQIWHCSGNLPPGMDRRVVYSAVFFADGMRLRKPTKLSGDVKNLLPGMEEGQKITCCPTVYFGDVSVPPPWSNSSTSIDIPSTVKESRIVNGGVNRFADVSVPKGGIVATYQLKTVDEYADMCLSNPETVRVAIDIRSDQDMVSLIALWAKGADDGPPTMHDFREAETQLSRFVAGVPKSRVDERKVVTYVFSQSFFSNHDPSNCNTRSVVGGGSLIVEATREIAAGDELLLDYGDMEMDPSVSYWLSARGLVDVISFAQHLVHSQ